jgi:flavin-binding protein dodecin
LTVTEEVAMSERVYGLSEVVGTSPESIEEAVRNAVRRAGVEHRHIDWFEVQQVRGYVRSNEVDHFQVTVKVGYRLEDA